MLVAFSTTALAQEFKDVPSGHWAESAVYKLVKLGVTKGYPDGTFRGNKTISRYEAAMLMSNLVNSVGAGMSEADKEKLKNEIMAELGVGFKIKGTYGVSGFITGLAGNNAKVLTREHRLDLTIANRGLIKGTEFALGWDTRTMETGRSGLVAAQVGRMNWGATDIAFGNVFDLYGKINLAECGIMPNTPITIEGSTGLGDQFHRGDAVKLMVGINKLKVGAGYSRLNGVTSLLANVNKYSVFAGYSLTMPGLGPTDIDFEGSAYNTAINPLNNNANRNFNIKVAVTSQPKDMLKLQGIFGLSGKSTTSMMLGGKAWLTGLMDNKLSAEVVGYKILSNYIRGSMEGWVDTDVFDDMIGDAAGNGETYIGAKVNYQVNPLIGIQFSMAMYLDGNTLGNLALSVWEPMVIITPCKRAQLYGAYRFWKNHTAGALLPNSDRIEAGMQVSI